MESLLARKFPVGARRRRPGVIAAAIAVAVLAAGCAGSGAARDESERGSGAHPPTATASGAPGPRLERCPGSDRTTGASAELPRVTLACLGRGPAVQMAARREVPQLVNVWASWCGPCRQEMPRLQAAHEAAGSRVLFLGVDTIDRAEAARAFLAEVGVTYPQVSDPEGRLRAGLGIAGIPVTLVVDRRGRVVYRHAGEVSPEQIQEALSRVGVSIPAPTGGGPSR